MNLISRRGFPALTAIVKPLAGGPPGIGDSSAQSRAGRSCYCCNDAKSVRRHLLRDERAIGTPSGCATQAAVIVSELTSRRDSAEGPGVAMSERIEWIDDRSHAGEKGG